MSEGPGTSQPEGTVKGPKRSEISIFWTSPDLGVTLASQPVSASVSLPTEPYSALWAAKKAMRPTGFEPA
jgi:hypothetical protein